MMFRAFMICAVLLTLAAPRALAASAHETCTKNFYQHKDAQCITTVIKQLNSQGIADDSGAINPPLIGFFAQIFSTDPALTAVILDKTATMKAAPLFIAALDKAGLEKEAQSYAAKGGHKDFYAAIAEKKATRLAAITPRDNPADNDYLIGAYMASGDIAHIKKILGNFTSASPQMAADALRISMVMNTFGPSFSPPGRKSEIMQFACARYECKKDRADLMRLLTLSSAFWALNSLAPSDVGIDGALKETFGGDTPLKNILMGENVAFSNYKVSLALLAVLPDNPDAMATGAAFESLKPAATLAIPPMKDK